VRRNRRLPADGLVAGTHNRHLLVAIQQQNRLRRFANHDWTFGPERVVISSREHLKNSRSSRNGRPRDCRSATSRPIRRRLKPTPQMAEGGRAGRRTLGRDGGGDAAGCGDLAAKRATLQRIVDELRRIRHSPIDGHGRWLATVLRGHYAYFAVPTNLPAVRARRNHVKMHWFLSLRRRSQRYRLT
jgi:hypothetical protein